MSAHQPEAKNPEIRSERSDANPTAILRFLVWLVFGCVVVAIAIRWMFVTLAVHEEKRQPPPPVMKPASVEQAPPPLLQEHPAQDLARYRQTQEEAIHRYAWVDKAGGFVQIDIDQAMKLTADRGLPTRSVGDGPSATSSPPPKPKGGDRK